MGEQNLYLNHTKLNALQGYHLSQTIAEQIL